MENPVFSTRTVARRQLATKVLAASAGATILAPHALGQTGTPPAAETGGTTGVRLSNRRSLVFMGPAARDMIGNLLNWLDGNVKPVDDVLGRTWESPWQPFHNFCAVG